jgi:hypothetical protein
MAMVVALASMESCSHQERIGTLSDSPVVVAGRAGGAVLERPKPIAGVPLAAVLAPGAGCIGGDRLLAVLGPTCSHETENSPGPVNAIDDLEPGKPKRSREIRWYCDERLIVRVVFEPCDANNDGKMDGISPVEVSVATHPEKAQP